MPWIVGVVILLVAVALLFGAIAAVGMKDNEEEHT